MCLAALCIDVSDRFPVVIAANRDERFDREAAPLAWWDAQPGRRVLSGRDLSGGGIWMGMDAAGRFALLTNVREPQRYREGAPSRGAIPLAWLLNETDPQRFENTLAESDYNGFNLLTCAPGFSGWQWRSNRAQHARPLGQGAWAVSNALLDDPWPKVSALKQRLHDSVTHAQQVDELAAALFEHLADRQRAADAALPQTGIPVERERALSCAFIHIPATATAPAYGTRCSTVLIAERQGGALRVHVIEQSFDAHAQAQHRVRIEHTVPVRAN
jgi:uncharacterized protein with NRDE domain